MTDLRQMKSRHTEEDADVIRAVLRTKKNLMTDGDQIVSAARTNVQLIGFFMAIRRNGARIDLFDLGSVKDIDMSTGHTSVAVKYLTGPLKERTHFENSVDLVVDAARKLLRQVGPL
jgi:hypothetical protein